jgi:hypothetical protein
MARLRQICRLAAARVESLGFVSVPRDDRRLKAFAVNDHVEPVKATASPPTGTQDTI